MSVKLLYYCPISYGGIADYAHQQANALVEAGAAVTLLCPPGYPAERGEKYKRLALLQASTPPPSLPKPLKSAYFAGVLLANFTRLADLIQTQGFRSVLLASYAEYLAPLWSWRLRRLATQGVKFAAVVHDPVRDFVVGPRWWHRWSIACGYSFLDIAFVHEAMALDTVRPFPQLQTVLIPHGPYAFAPPQVPAAEFRQRWHLPPEARVMLAFGHLRDNKNLDLVLQAMEQFPNLYLVVAGKPVSGTQRSPEFYQDLARQLGVSDRCRWHIGLIPDAEIGNFFAAADLVLLTYSRSFRSASGVLHTAIHYRKPCLASGGEGPLRSAIQNYHLGIWVEPDSVAVIATGIQQWLEQPPQAQWQRYLEEHSWEINARSVLQAFASPLA